MMMTAHFVTSDALRQLSDPAKLLGLRTFNPAPPEYFNVLSEEDSPFHDKHKGTIGLEDQKPSVNLFADPPVKPRL